MQNKYFHYKPVKQYHLMVIHNWSWSSSSLSNFALCFSSWERWLTGPITEKMTEESIVLENVQVLQGPNHFKWSQLMRLWYLSHRQPAKAQTSLRICAVSPEPSLFAHIKYGSRRRVLPKIRRLAPLDGCACTFEEWVYGGRKVPKPHELAQWIVMNNLFSS